MYYEPFFLNALYIENALNVKMHLLLKMQQKNYKAIIFLFWLCAKLQNAQYAKVQKC